MIVDEVIVPADPVLLAQAWLRSMLPADVVVVKDRPTPLTGQVVTVRRSGGTPSDLVTDAAWLALEVFAPSDIAAAQLGHHVWGLLAAMRGEVIDGVQCYRVQTLGGPADMPLNDPGDLQRPRMVMSVQVTFRAAALTV